MAFTVEAFFALKDKMSVGLDRIQQSFKGVEQSANASQAVMDKAQGVAGDLKGTLFQLGAALGVTYGVKELAQAMIDANAEIEQTEKKLGGLLSGLYEFNKDPAKNFRAGMAESTRMIQAFDDAEGELGIDKGELLQTAQRLLPAFAGANKSIEDTIEFTKTFSDISKQLGQNAETSAMYVNQMLQYGMVPRRSPLFQAIGVSREEMKKLKTEGQRFDYLMKKLKVFDTGEMHKVQTFNETMERIKISVGNIYEDAGKPLFEDAKYAARELLDALNRNDEQVKRVARDIGEKVGTGMKVAAGGAEVVLDNFDALWSLTKGIGVALAAWKVAPAVIAAFEAIASGMGAGAVATWLAGLSAGVLALAAAAGVAIGEAMVGVWKLTGTWDTVANALSFGALDEAKRRQAEMESDMARGRAVFRTEMTAKIAELNKAAATAELVAAYNKTQSDSIREDLMTVARSRGIDLKAAAAPKARGGGNTIFNNNRFDIKQDFAEGFDPDRIAVAFASDLARLGEMKMQSQFAPVGSMR